MLRSGALRDDRVIRLLNHDVVPVWINVRRDPVPDVPALARPLFVGHLDESRRITDAFNGGFYLRSMLLTPDGSRVLNPEPDTFWGSVGNFYAKGHYSYATVDADPYLGMLTKALDDYQFCKDHPLARCL